MRLLICGSRSYSDRKRIREYLIRLKPEVVIEGGARGADRIAYDEAHKLGIRVESYRPDWRRYGKRAGILRNSGMLEMGKPDFCLAFFDGKLSTGTLDMVEQCKAAGIDGRTIGLTREQIEKPPLTLDGINTQYQEYLKLQDTGIWKSFQEFRDDPDVMVSLEMYYCHVDRVREESL